MLLLLGGGGFLRFLAGLPTALWYNWLPGQRIPSVYGPWGQGQLEQGQNQSYIMMAVFKDKCTKMKETKVSISFTLSSYVV